MVKTITAGGERMAQRQSSNKSQQSNRQRT